MSVRGERGAGGWASQALGRAALVACAAVGLAIAGALGWTSWGDGPWGMLPGGALRGAVHPCPTHWDGLGPRELAVEVRPHRPRSVKTWSIASDGVLFVPADFLTPGKRWPFQVQADDRVRLRAGGPVFECRLARVEDASRIRLLRRAIAAKYEIESESWAARSEVWWFEVRPR